VALAAAELVLLFGVLRLFARIAGPELLPSLKVVFDMIAMASGGWVAGRLGAPRVFPAAASMAVGLTALDLTPFLPLNVPWVLQLTRNAVTDSRFLSSLGTTLIMHALLFGALFLGAHLSRPPEPPTTLRFDA
jgi:hypothetical protein